MTETHAQPDRTNDAGLVVTAYDTNRYAYPRSEYLTVKCQSAIMQQQIFAILRLGKSAPTTMINIIY